MNNDRFYSIAMEFEIIVVVRVNFENIIGIARLAVYLLDNFGHSSKQLWSYF